MTPETLQLNVPATARLAGIVALTVLSGLADAQGFVHSAAAFDRPDAAWLHVARAVIFFALGLITYLLAVRGLVRAGIAAPELHMLFWFAVTIVGVALLSGNLVTWSSLDRTVGAVVVTGIAWLVWRVA